MNAADLLRSLPKKKRADAIWLLSAIFAKNRSDVLLGFALSPADLQLWERSWKRRLRGEPLQYIWGKAPFWSRDFIVNPRVLIPRPETECLIPLCLQLLGDSGRVLDIGTGSGAIALTLKLERPALAVTASDVSSAALKVAAENASALGADVKFVRANLFAPALRKQQWDVVVSNPPYLEFRKDKVTAEVKEWEPHLALEPAKPQKVAALDRAAWCGERILRACQENRPRFTALELSPRIATLLEKRWRRQEGVKSIERLADLSGRKRFLLVAWDHG